jgi:hypothetical protein
LSKFFKTVFLFQLLKSKHPFDLKSFIQNLIPQNFRNQPECANLTCFGGFYTQLYVKESGGNPVGAVDV